MSKLYRVDTNVDTSKVIEAWLTMKSKQAKDGGEGRYTPSEYFKLIIMQAVSSAHKSGNLGVLRRTQTIAKEIDEAIKGDGMMILPEEDYKYMVSSMGKAEWNNSLEIAESIQPVMEALNKAEVVE